MPFDDDEIPPYYGTWLRPSKLHEADGLMLTIVEHPEGNPEKFAFVMEYLPLRLKLYYLLTKGQVIETIDALVSQIGWDA